MRTVVFLLASALTAFAADGWQPIFNGTSLEGWKADANPTTWTVKDGAIRGEGSASNLSYTEQKCSNCEFMADVRISAGAAGRMYLRAASMPGTPRGYEAQLDNSNSDLVRTGSLYGLVKIHEQLIPDGVWFTEHVIVDGNHVRVFVNDRQTADYSDQNDSFVSGYVGFADVSGVVEFKNVMMKVLPGPSSPLSGLWRINAAQSSAGQSNGAGQPSDIRVLDEGTGIRYVSGPANTFLRVDGYDYRTTGSPAYDHVSMQSVDRHPVHLALIKAKVRKKLDAHTFLVIATKDYAPVLRAVFTVSPDGKTLTREVTPAAAAGETPKTTTDVFTRVE